MNIYFIFHNVYFVNIRRKKYNCFKINIETNIEFKILQVHFIVLSVIDYSFAFINMMVDWGMNFLEFYVEYIYIYRYIHVWYVHDISLLLMSI